MSNTVTKLMAKLIESTLISYQPNSLYFCLELLHDYGSSFILDLSDAEDLEEFDNLIKFFDCDTLEKEFTLENVSSTLTIKLEYGALTFNHETGAIAELFQNPVDVFDRENAQVMVNFLKDIRRSVSTSNNKKEIT